MPNGLRFKLLLVAVLVVLFTLLAMTFAQEVPFQVEVVVNGARMRWGPGPTYAVQHYANAGNSLTVLEVDSTSDPPWTWYYARTPSGVESWIRGDLVRDTGAAVPPPARIDSPSGTYPVRDNNFCNTDLFRACQEGTDFNLWEAGYWARDRYDHWERGGWHLDTVFYLNPCRTDRVCPTREQWDAGLIEAQLLAVTLTPEATLTPIVVTVVVTGEGGGQEFWERYTDTGNTGLFGGAGSTQLYTPPRGLYPETGTRWGEFRLNSENIRVDCYYWHNAFEEENVKSGRFGVSLGRLLTRTVNGEPRPNDADITASNLNCGSESRVADNIFARQWKIRVTRGYSGRDQIGGISWRLEGTYGQEPTSVTSTNCGPAPGGACIVSIDTADTTTRTCTITSDRPCLPVCQAWQGSHGPTLQTRSHQLPDVHSERIRQEYRRVGLRVMNIPVQLIQPPWTIR